MSTSSGKRIHYHRLRHSLRRGKMANYTSLFIGICLLTASPSLADYQNPAFERGMGCMSHRDYDGAIIEFGEAIGFNDTNSKNYLMRGQAFSHTHNYELAIQDFNKSLEFAPNNSETYLWRGTAQSKLGKDDLAIKDYEQAIRLDPKLADKFFSQPKTSTPGHLQARAISRNGQTYIVGDKRAYETRNLNDGAIRDYEQAMSLVYPDRVNSNLKSDDSRAIIRNSDQTKNYLDEYRGSQQDESASN